jgi:ABC-type dipeptide/oligopeptide/nickel transport system ATPase subunit
MLSVTSATRVLVATTPVDLRGSLLKRFVHAFAGGQDY